MNIKTVLQNYEFACEVNLMREARIARSNIVITQIKSIGKETMHVYLLAVRAMKNLQYSTCSCRLYVEKMFQPGCRCLHPGREGLGTCQILKYGLRPYYETSNFISLPPSNKTKKGKHLER